MDHNYHNYNCDASLCALRAETPNSTHSRDVVISGLGIHRLIDYHGLLRDRHFLQEVGIRNAHTIGDFWFSDGDGFDPLLRMADLLVFQTPICNETP